MRVPISREELFLYLCPFETKFCKFFCCKHDQGTVRVFYDDLYFDKGSGGCQLTLFTAVQIVRVAKLIPGWVLHPNLFEEFFGVYCLERGCDHIAIWDQIPFGRVIRKGRDYAVEVVSR